MHDEEKKLLLFEEFQRSEYTRRLIIMKENARPTRPVKQLAQMLKCVNNFTQKIVKEEDKSDGE